MVASEEHVALAQLCPEHGPGGDAEVQGQEMDVGQAGDDVRDLAQQAEGVEGEAKGGAQRAVLGGGRTLDSGGGGPGGEAAVAW